MALPRRGRWSSRVQAHPEDITHPCLSTSREDHIRPPQHDMRSSQARTHRSDMPHSHRCTALPHRIRPRPRGRWILRSGARWRGRPQMHPCIPRRRHTHRRMHDTPHRRLRIHWRGTTPLYPCRAQQRRRRPKTRDTRSLHPRARRPDRLHCCPYSSLRHRMRPWRCGTSGSVVRTHWRGSQHFPSRTLRQHRRARLMRDRCFQRAAHPQGTPRLCPCTSRVDHTRQAQAGRR
jgi:hypothetical protein